MKEYPSIPRSGGQSFSEIKDAYIFDKLDGSSMRSEWNRKRGWFKHGKRHGLIDNSNPHLVTVPKLFDEQLAEALAKIAVNNKWQTLVVFYEFWGSKSFAGMHEEGDEKRLTLFDAAPNKKGFMSPAEFRKAFEDHVDTAKFLGIAHWTRGYIDTVKAGEIEGITFEGVVAKALVKNNIVRAKAKTQAWIDKVYQVHGEAGKKIVES